MVVYFAGISGFARLRPSRKESSTVSPNRLIQTSHGPLEYAVLGEGLPLVVMHGSGGGVRQGLVMRYLLDTRRIQIIALSRPGYWGTPLETAPEIEQQADRVVELLDALKIETAAVLGHSAGDRPRRTLHSAIWSAAWGWCCSRRSCRRQMRGWLG